LVQCVLLACGWAAGVWGVVRAGKGRVIMRGAAHIEEMRGNRFRIVITEIPYQLNKTSLLERIASLARDGKIDSISDLRDESDRRGMSIIVELKRGSQPKKVLNQLYKYTTLQSTFGVQMLALLDNEPKLHSLKRALQIFIEHRRDVITRRTQFDLDKARARAHILDGLIIALDNIDAVIETIRASSDVEEARNNLISRFKLTELQAQAILDMQLRRLSALERWKIEEEHKELMAKIAYYEDLLANPKKILAIIKEDLIELSEKYGDERRTLIAANASGDLNEEDLVEDESVLVTITERGYIKRVVAKTFRTQGRGGRGVKGHTTKEEDEVMMIIPARTLDTILFFTDKGKVYSEKTYQIPEATRTAKGISIFNILALEPDEHITAAIPVPDFDHASFCTLATKMGRIKRVAISQFASVRPSGLIAMGLNDGDELGWARLTSGDDEVIIVTENGKALRYHETEVRAMGRPAAGVIAIKLKGDDRVTTMDVVKPNSSLLTVTETGVGKQTLLEEYSPKGRATQGILTIDKHALGEIGKIIAARVVQAEDHLTLISTEGVIIRLKVKDVKTAGRATRGVHLMRTREGDTVAAVARIAADDLKQAGAKLEEKEDEQKELL